MELLIELRLQSCTFPNMQQALRDSQPLWVNCPNWKAEAVMVWVNVWLAKSGYHLEYLCKSQPLEGGRSVHGFGVGNSFECGGSFSTQKTFGAVPFLWWLLAGVSGGGCTRDGTRGSSVQSKQICLCECHNTPSCASKIAHYNIPWIVIWFSTLYGFRYCWCR